MTEHELRKLLKSLGYSIEDGGRHRHVRNATGRLVAVLPKAPLRDSSPHALRRLRSKLVRGGDASTT